MVGIVRDNVQKQVENQNGRYDGNGIPLVMRKGLEEVAFKHARRGHKQPVRRINDLQVAFVV